MTLDEEITRYAKVMATVMGKTEAEYEQDIRDAMRVSEPGVTIDDLMVKVVVPPGASAEEIRKACLDAALAATEGANS